MAEKSSVSVTGTAKCNPSGSSRTPGIGDPVSATSGEDRSGVTVMSVSRVSAPAGASSRMTTPAASMVSIVPPAAPTTPSR